MKHFKAVTWVLIVCGVLSQQALGLPEIEELVQQSNRAMQVADSLIGDSKLFLVSLEKLSSGTCSEQSNRVYRFINSARTQMATVSFLFQAAAGGCKELLLKDVRPVPAQFKFEEFSLAVVKVSPQQILLNASELKPEFQWDRRLQLMKDAAHGEAPFYVVQGTQGGTPVSHVYDAVTGKPMSEVDEAFADYKMWYCRADSYATGRWYYWYSYNLAYARYQALGACQLQNGNTCVYRCW